MSSVPQTGLAEATASPGKARPQRDYTVALLIALIAIAALIPSILLAGVALDRWSRIEELRERDRVATLAQGAAQSLDRHLKSLINTAEVLAGSRHLQTGDIDVFESIARDAAVNADGEFVLVNSELQQLVNTRVAIGTPLPKTGNPQRVAEVFRTGKPIVTDLNQAAVGNDIVFAILVPVKIEQTVRYVLAFAPKPSTVFDVLAERYRPAGWFGAVIDGRGQIVARTEGHNEFFGRQSTLLNQVSGESGIMESIDLQGRGSVTAFHRLNSADWVSVAWVLKSQLAEPRQQRFRLLVAMITAALVLSFLASWAVSRLVRTPALRLVDLANRVGQSEPLHHEHTLMREANVIGQSLARASCDIRERTSELQAVGQRLQLAIDAAGAGFWTMDLATGEHHLDQRARDIAGFGTEEAIDIASLINRIHEDDRGLVTDALRSARSPGGEGHFDVEFRFVMPDGSVRWASTQAQQLKSSDGALQLVGIVRDVTRRKRDEQKIKLLMREVVHRSKNLLAVVQSIAGQTARTGDPASFLPRFRDRLSALAASQTLLVESEWKGVSVEELAKAQLSHFEDLFGRRLTFDGELARLKPEAAQAIGMALHELSTNAAKYGALSKGDGTVHVAWRISSADGQKFFHISWTERGGPEFDAPAKPGFGTIVTGKMVESAVNGTVSIRRDDGAFTWALDADGVAALDPNL